jgi:dUTP pyrophosphatase
MQLTRGDRGEMVEAMDTRSTASAAPVLGVIRLSHGEGLDLPAYETAGAAGMDLRAAVPDDAPLSIAPGGRALVPTGLIVEIPQGYEGQVRPRSGLAFKHGVTCLNTPGTIDCDYRGELKVLLVNLGEEPFDVTRGLRMAQLVIAPVTQARVELRVAVSETARGAGGFGSTGTN